MPRLKTETEMDCNTLNPGMLHMLRLQSKPILKQGKDSVPPKQQSIIYKCIYFLRKLYSVIVLLNNNYNVCNKDLCSTSID